MIHKDPHPLAGRTVKIKASAGRDANGTQIGGADYRIEDWWDRIAGESWGDCQGNPACIMYALRTGLKPKEDPASGLDDEVVYGKIGAIGHLVHVSELEAT